MRHIHMPLYSNHQFGRSALALGTALFITILGAPLSLHAQQLNSASSSNESATLALRPASELPDAPSALQNPPSGQPPTSAPAQQTPTQTGNPAPVNANDAHQTKRILGIMPNFSAVSADTKLPPQTPKEKLLLAGRNSFDYSSFLIAGIQAGFAMNGKSYPEFHQGVAGYGRYYWHTLADTADENFMVSGMGPILFHQDNRFYTLGHGGFRKRAFYAVTRVLITRQDDGDKMFNFSEVIGSGAAAGASTLYYPTKYRTWTKVGQKWLTSDIIDGANFTFKEFWPDINKKIFHTH
jgi:hypothetical protein